MDRKWNDELKCYEYDEYPYTTHQFTDGSWEIWEGRKLVANYLYLDHAEAQFPRLRQEKEEEAAARATRHEENRVTEVLRCRRVLDMGWFFGQDRDYIRRKAAEAI